MNLKLPFAPSRVGRALRHRNYRLFFFGQGVSLVGTWFTRFAIGYATFQLTGSEADLGLVSFFGLAPTAVIAPFAGVLVDRWNRHRTVVWMQVFAMLQSGALAASAFTHTLTVYHLFALGAVQGVINAFDMPARQTFVRQMIEDRADLPNAIALNSSLVNAARLIGPVIAGVLVVPLGVGWCFALDAASYIAVITSLMMMTVKPQPVRTATAHIRDELLEGLAYVRGHRVVRTLLILLATSSVFGGAYNALMPAVAERSLGGGPHLLSALMASTGAGALVGALYLANQERTEGMRKVVVNCAALLGVGLMALEIYPTVWLAAPLMFLVGLALIVQWAATNTLVQTLVDEDKLGRVISIHALVFFAGVPVGALLQGALAESIGPIHALAIGGTGCFICALVFRGALLRDG